MKKSDLSIDRQRLLVRVDEYPGAHALIPPPTPSLITLPGIANEVARAHEALGVLKSLTLKLPNPHFVTRTLDRREAVRSSQMEGTSSDINDLFAYEATGSGEGLPPDVVVTLNYVKALDYGLEQVQLHGGVAGLTSDLIKGTHKQLMNGVKGFNGVPGAFREKQNWIGGFNIYEAKLVPPPARHVQKCMDDLEMFLRNPAPEDQQYVVPLVIRMAIAHAQFETIHPFVDGNGRTGRILMPLMLAAEGYPPVYLAGYLKTNQREYFDTLLNVQLQDKWTDWIKFFATGVTLAVQESMRTAEELIGILDNWQKLVANHGIRSDSAVNKLLEMLIGKPVVTANQVKDLLGVSFPAASNALAKLEEIGIVHQPDKQVRNRTFVAQAVIELLNRASPEIETSRTRPQKAISVSGSLSSLPRLVSSNKRL